MIYPLENEPFYAIAKSHTKDFMCTIHRKNAAKWFTMQLKENSVQMQPNRKSNLKHSLYKNGRGNWWCLISRCLFCLFPEVQQLGLAAKKDLHLKMTIPKMRKTCWLFLILRRKTDWYFHRHTPYPKKVTFTYLVRNLICNISIPASKNNLSLWYYDNFSVMLNFMTFLKSIKLLPFFITRISL